MTMPSLISTGWSSELSRLMTGRSWRNRPTLCPNWRPNASISLSKPNASAFGQARAISSVPAPGRISSIDASIHSRARLYASRWASVALPTTNVR
jgi:hypothetical protein